MAGKATGKWLTLAFLALLIFAALTAHAAALTISSKDTVEIAMLVDMNKTNWEKMETGDIADVRIDKPTIAKITLTSEKQKIEPVVQINPGASLVVSANYAGGDADIVQVGKDKIEGYYSYGKSSTYPWGIYWCIHDVGGKPMIVFSEFSKRSVWYSPISSDQVEEITGILNNGEIPDVITIQKAAGA